MTLRRNGNTTPKGVFMKILIDMYLSPAWVNELHKNGFDAVHWSEIGKANAPDVEIFN
jgi:predicted nuclease of predicted toxin-antitoxin system